MTMMMIQRMLTVFLLLTAWGRSHPQWDSPLPRAVLRVHSPEQFLTP